MYGGTKTENNDRFIDLITAWGDRDFDDVDEELVALDDALARTLQADDDFENDDSELETPDTEDEHFHYPVPTVITKDSLEQYQKRGPFGKLHNHGVVFKQSSQMLDAWEEAQVAAHS